VRLRFARREAALLAERNVDRHLAAFETVSRQRPERGLWPLTPRPAVFAFTGPTHRDQRACGFAVVEPSAGTDRWSIHALSSINLYLIGRRASFALVSRYSHDLDKWLPLCGSYHAPGAVSSVPFVRPTLFRPDPSGLGAAGIRGVSGCRLTDGEHFSSRCLGLSLALRCSAMPASGCLHIGTTTNNILNLEARLERQTRAGLFFFRASSRGANQCCRVRRTTTCDKRLDAKHSITALQSDHGGELRRTGGRCAEPTLPSTLRPLRHGGSVRPSRSGSSPHVAASASSGMPADRSALRGPCLAEPLRGPSWSTSTTTSAANEVLARPSPSWRRGLRERGVQQLVDDLRKNFFLTIRERRPRPLSSAHVWLSP